VLHVEALRFSFFCTEAKVGLSLAAILAVVGNAAYVLRSTSTTAEPEASPVITQPVTVQLTGSVILANTPVGGVEEPPLTITVMDATLLGISAVTSALNVGLAALPVVGPAQTEFANCVLRLNVRAGVAVAVATLVVAIESRAPQLKLVTVPVPAGISAVTSARYVGAPAAPVAGPAKTEFVAALVRLNVRAGVVVAVATLVVNSGLRVPAEKLVV